MIDRVLINVLAYAGLCMLVVIVLGLLRGNPVDDIAMLIARIAIIAVAVILGFVVMIQLANYLDRDLD